MTNSLDENRMTHGITLQPTFRTSISNELAEKSNVNNKQVKKRYM
jgi:hypothetical protein